jgi:hypothetical protein
METCGSGGIAPSFLTALQGDEWSPSLMVTLTNNKQLPLNNISLREYRWKERT